MRDTGIPSVRHDSTGAEADPIEGGSAADPLGAPLPDPDEAQPAVPDRTAEPDRPAGPMDPKSPGRPAGPMDPTDPGTPSPTSPLP